MKTGNTAAAGHIGTILRDASMEPGHEDREYPRIEGAIVIHAVRLNGARS